MTIIKRLSLPLFLQPCMILVSGYSPFNGVICIVIIWFLHIDFPILRWWRHYWYPNVITRLKGMRLMLLLSFSWAMELREHHMEQMARKFPLTQLPPVFMLITAFLSLENPKYSWMGHFKAKVCSKSLSVWLANTTHRLSVFSMHPWPTFCSNVWFKWRAFHMQSIYAGISIFQFNHNYPHSFFVLVTFKWSAHFGPDFPLGCSNFQWCIHGSMLFPVSFRRSYWFSL